MSTIEEAREQAREALELIHKWRQREQAWDTPRALDFERIGVSIRALLDATEPQETTTPAAKSQLEAVTNAIEKVLDGQDALHCTRVWEAWGYGTMSEDDFSPVTNDAEAVNEIASAVLEALGPRPITDEGEREALKYLCRRHAACRSTGWPPSFEHSVGCAEWNSGRVAEGARR